MILYLWAMRIAYGVNNRANAIDKIKMNMIVVIFLFFRCLVFVKFVVFFVWCD